MKKTALVLAGLMTAGMILATENGEKKSLLPDYSQPVGFTYGLGADIVSNYIWRGLYVGGLGVQLDANVGYGGAFIDMWWNLGATDWTFNKMSSNGRIKGFNPEVDMTLGFSRWGLTVMFMHMYYFDRYKNFDGTLGDNSRYFDFSNAAPGGGITQEWRVKYRVSDALPISILWCTRTWGRDGYMVDGNGKQISTDDYIGMADEQKTLCGTKRAYSSYLELGYDIYMPKSLTLEARVGMTPWKSMYTSYLGDFAVCNVSAKLNWHKDLSEHCMMTAFANLMINPFDMAYTTTTTDADGNTITNHFNINGANNPFLWNIGCGFYLK